MAIHLLSKLRSFPIQTAQNIASQPHSNLPCSLQTMLPVPSAPPNQKIHTKMRKIRANEKILKITSVSASLLHFDGKLIVIISLQQNLNRITEGRYSWYFPLRDPVDTGDVISIELELALTVFELNECLGHLCFFCRR